MVDWSGGDSSRSHCSRWDIQGDSESDSSRPWKRRTTKYEKLEIGNPESDNYIREYVMFHYDFYRTEGFGIEWDKFHYFFPHCCPYDGAPRLEWHRTNKELIEEATNHAIRFYNVKNGTNIVFYKHIEANFACNGFFQNWITFYAIDKSSSCKEPKVYQAYTVRHAVTYEVPIFRVKPTEKEMAAAPIHVEPPRPYHFDPSKPYVSFHFAGREDDPVPGTPFIFRRIEPNPMDMFPPKGRKVQYYEGGFYY